jgi:hypothetical protein
MASLSPIRLILKPVGTLAAAGAVLVGCWPSPSRVCAWLSGSQHRVITRGRSWSPIRGVLEGKVQNVGGALGAQNSVVGGRETGSLLDRLAAQIDDIGHRATAPQTPRHPHTRWAEPRARLCRLSAECRVLLEVPAETVGGVPPRSAMQPLVRPLDESAKFGGDCSTQLTMPLVRVCASGIVPHVLRVPPHRAANLVRRLPVVAGMNVSVQYRDRVAEHLVVDPAQPIASAGALQCLAHQRQVEQEPLATLPVEVGEVIHGPIVGEEHRVAWQMLSVADHGEAAAHPRHHKRVLAPERGADPIVTPVTRHSQTLDDLGAASTVARDPVFDAGEQATRPGRIAARGPRARPRLRSDRVRTPCHL